ncbi:MAG: hypothetical protein H7210_02770 [Pyrinomonadaceae bacterium]|nr:hypothetical protein [Phycisphaerales bacterium]
MSTIAIKPSGAPIVIRFVLAVVMLCFESLFTTGCAPLCGNQLVRTIAQPTGSKSIVIFERDCGATTDFVIHLSVIESGTALSDGMVGNTFIADSNKGQVNMNVEAEWTSPLSVVIRYPAGARVHSRNSSVGHVRVAYEEF